MSYRIERKRDRRPFADGFATKEDAKKWLQDLELATGLAVKAEDFELVEEPLTRRIYANE